jgi:pilus assembly protein CpaC
MSIKSRIGLLILFIAIAGATDLYAAEEPGNVSLLVGRSTVIDVGSPIARVSLTSSDVADALVTSPAQLLVHGKTPGTISMFIWDRAGAIRRYDVVVQRDLTRLVTQMGELFPGERINVQGNGRSVIVAGMASSKFVADKAVEVAAGYVDKKDDVVNLLQVQTGGANQVLLHVRFAEVSRSALTELGAGFFTSPTGIKNTLARVTTQQFPAPGFDELKWSKANSDFGSDVTNAEGKFTFSDFLNLFVFSQKYDLGAIIRLLQTRGLFESLAEPNLVTESGKEASFLAGGEIPVPIAQGTGGNVAISVSWKEFGIRLNFTPTVNGDRVNLKVRPEVSSLDFTNAIVLQGFRIPALSTRRADTEIELQNNQTFAIAGLLNNTATQQLQKVPGIGDIPIIGLLFKSKAAQKNTTELVVMITPEILAPNSPGVTRELPRLTEPYLQPPAANKTFPSPAPAFGRQGSGGANAEPQPGAPVAGASPVPQGSGTPDARPVAPVPARPLTAEDKKAAQRAERLALEQQKRDAKLAEQQQKKDREAAQVQKERDEKLAREQAKRDAEQARRNAEAAKRQAELDREHQKEIDEAAAKLKAAEQAYQAELAKRGNTQSSQQPQ